MKVKVRKTNLVRLTQGKFTEVDIEDIPWITKHKWYAKKTTAKNKTHGNYYAARFQRVNGNPTTIYLHREIMNCPYDMEIDHKNGNSLCNTRENLKPCTKKENLENRYF